VNVVPLPIPALSARTHPPWAVTMAFANARLSPVPPGVVHRIGDGERPEKLWRQLWRKPLPVIGDAHDHPLRRHTDIDSEGFRLPGELQRIVHQDMNHFRQVTFLTSNQAGTVGGEAIWTSTSDVAKPGVFSAIRRTTVARSVVADGASRSVASQANYSSSFLINPEGS
jgi:hypothetical protein